MKGTAFLFMITAVVFIVLGMGWGIQMSAAGDFKMAPAHGHLNLVGFVLMSIFGLYYAITPQADGTLARLHYALTVLTVVLLAAGIAMAINQSGETLAKVSSILGVLTMLLFGFIVLKNGVGKAAA